jgi:hypothetical protein
MNREEAQRILARFGDSTNPRERMLVNEALLVLDGCSPAKAEALVSGRRATSEARAAASTSDAPAATELRHRVFRLSDHADHQLLLALVICIGRRVGVDSYSFYDFLDEHRKPGSVHQNIDREWTSAHEVQRALSRLKRQGLVRNGPLAFGDQSIWRLTPAGEAFLASRLLFAVTVEERNRRARRRPAA